jgi:YtkA-like
MLRHLRVHGYDVDVRVTPNRAGAITHIALHLLERGRPVTGARVTLTTMMMEMDMGYTGRLLQRGPGRYVHAWPPFMPGAWRLHYDVVPPGGKRFRVTVVDRLG